MSVIGTDRACQKPEPVAAGLDQRSGSVLRRIWPWCLCSGARQAMPGSSPLSPGGSSLGLCGSPVSRPG